jgi:hypothetical protein
VSEDLGPEVGDPIAGTIDRGVASRATESARSASSRAAPAPAPSRDEWCQGHPGGPVEAWQSNTSGTFSTWPCPGYAVCCAHLLVNVVKNSSALFGRMILRLNIAKIACRTRLVRVFFGHMVGNPFLNSLNLQVNLAKNCWLSGEFLFQGSERWRRRASWRLCPRTSGTPRRPGQKLSRKRLTPA